jgi:hypothetical protein
VDLVSRLACAALIALVGCAGGGRIGPLPAGAGGPDGGNPGLGGGGGTAATGAGGSKGPAIGNASSGLTLLGSIVFSPPSQTFQDELQVTMSAMSTPGATVEIRYTTDGQAPSAASTLYDGAPLRLTATTQIRAAAFANGAPAGFAGTGLYVARSFDVPVDLPLVVLDAYGHGPLSLTDRSFVDGAFMTFDASGGSTALSASPSLAARAGFHVHGQSSATFEKTPYRVELRGPTDLDEDHAVLGMPADSDWVLNGPYPDKALIRNAFVYSLGRDMGMAAPRFAFAELYLNVSLRPLGANDYRGVYIVVETVKDGKDRLKLKKLKPEDLTFPAIDGGYIFKFDLGVAVPPLLTCTGAPGPCWKDLELVAPQSPQAAQEAYVTKYIQAFHDTLNGTDYTDRSIGYAMYINPATFVDQIIIAELTRNMDAYVRSQYFYKDRGAKISAGPLWDYDLTFDVGGALDNRNVDGWQYEQSAERPGVDNTWFQRLLTAPAFAAQVVARWQSLRQGLLSDAQVDARIDMLTAPLANAAARNFARWPILTSNPHVDQFESPTERTWQGQVEHMRAWIKARMAWIDTQWR